MKHNPAQSDEHAAPTVGTATLTATPLLSENDTYNLYTDALDITLLWADARTVLRVGGDIPNGVPVSAWAVELFDDDKPDTVYRIGHREITAAMRRIVDQRDAIRLKDTIIDQIQAVLDAPDPETAICELLTLDSIGYDAIVQVATLGNVIH